MSIVRVIQNSAAYTKRLFDHGQKISTSLLFESCPNTELIYDDAFKNYLWVKVFDENVFAIVKSTVFFICLCFYMVFLRGQKSLGPEIRLDWSPFGV